jgi:archaellum biogenesis ATPase FlaH
MSVITMEDVYKKCHDSLYIGTDMDRQTFSNILSSKEQCDLNFKIIDLMNPIMTNEARDKIKNIPDIILKEEIRFFLKKEIL